MTATLPYFDADAVRNGSPMTALIEALRTAFAGDTVAPARHSHTLGGNTSLLLMPAWRNAGDLGLKITVVDRDARPSVQASYILLDQTTAAPAAVLDGAALTVRRTAAASALATDYLARQDASTLLILGTGALVPALAEAHSAVRPIRRILIWGRNAAKAAMTVEHLIAQGHTAQVATDIDVALPQADIVSSATLATTPLIRGSLLRHGTHIDLVGAFRPEMCEADPDAFARSRVFVDTFGGALEEAGDLIQAIAAGAIRAGDIQADLATLCRGRHQGRKHHDDLTLFKSVGTALEDLAAARLVLTSAYADA